MDLGKKSDIEKQVSLLVENEYNMFPSIRGRSVGVSIVIQEGAAAGDLFSFSTGEDNSVLFSKIKLEVKKRLDIGEPFRHLFIGGYSIVSIIDEQLCAIGSIWIFIEKGDIHDDVKGYLFSLSNRIKEEIFLSKRRYAAKCIRNALSKNFLTTEHLESYMDVLGQQVLCADFVCTWIEDDGGDLKTSISGINLKRGLGIASKVMKLDHAIICRNLSEGITINDETITPYHYEFLKNRDLNSAVFVPLKLDFQKKLGVIAFYFSRPNGCTSCDKMLASKLANFFTHHANEILFRNALWDVQFKNANAFILLLDTFKILHDVDNATNEIDGHLDTIQINPQKAAEYVPSLKSSIDKLFELSDQAQAIKNGAEKGISLDHARRKSFSRRNARDLAKSIRTRHNLRLGNVGIALNISVADDFRFRVDQESLNRIIDNLIYNAEYALSVSGQRTEKRIDVEFEWESPLFSVSVKDSGPGFETDEERRQALQPFVSKKPGGWGLGLVICADLASSMGGRLDTWSKWGHGAKFTIRLPIGL